MIDDADFVELIDLCYRTVDTPESWQAVTAAISRGLDAEAGDIAIEDYEAGVARALGSVGFDPLFRESYDDAFLASNGWIEELKKYPRGKSVPNQAEPENFDKTPFYNEWLRPQGLRHGVGSILEDNPIRTVHIGFVRAADHAMFAPDDVRYLDRILPHVHRAIRIGEKLRVAHDGQYTLFTLVDALRIPGFLLDGAKTVIHANEAADVLCQSDTGLTLVQGKLISTNHNANGTLQAALEAACRIDLQAKSASRAEVVIPRAGEIGRPLVVELVPLRSEAAHGVGQPRSLVLVNETGRPLPARLHLLQQAWNLTRTEARLAWALANGDTIIDYAARFDIAASTARWHLKNIQSKTATCSLEALVGVVRATILRL